MLGCLLLLALAGCQQDRSSWSDAQLGLTAQQARGRRSFNARCANCHEAYVDRPRNGPSMKDLYKNKYLPSGAPSNDERVRDAILLGRPNMPGYRSVMDEREMEDLMAYLHTL
ncbi:MAG TPA: cytochrome c [Terriglobales bacterium]|nr:cytochrome c [Terriglobales bacterium]